MAECKAGTGGSAQPKTGYVLIADEHAGGRIYTSMLIQRFGYNSCTASSGEDAFEMAKTALPALIIIDHELPGMPSVDLVRQLRRDAGTASVPVIVKGARIADGDKQRYREAGVTAFLDLPETAESLFRAVQRAIEATPRSNIRIRTRLPVVVDGKQLDCGHGECVSELSEYGMYIRTHHPWPLHKKVSVQVTFQDRTIDLEAEVLYCHQSGEGPFREPGMGLKFIFLNPRDRNYLKAYIHEEITKGMPRR